MKWESFYEAFFLPLRRHSKKDVDGWWWSGKEVFRNWRNLAHFLFQFYSFQTIKEKENFDSLKKKILTVWKRKILTVWKGKFWQFEKGNFDSLKRKFLTVWKWKFWQFGKGKFWQFGKGKFWQFEEENFDSLEKENFDSLKRKILWDSVSQTTGH